jgi:hypothetical protein
MNNNLINSNYYNRLASLIPAANEKNATASASDFSNLLQNAVSGTSNLDDIFQRAAAAYHVPENLLKAVAKVESGYDPNAVSGSGAQGVMQLMPSTASSLGVQDPFDAEQNIMGGAKYLSQMLARYGGDPQLALAAYNAGSGNVEKYGGIPPFKETQNYVTRVMNDAGLDSSSTVNPLSSLRSLLGTSSSSTQLSALSFLLGTSSGQSSSLDSMMGTSSLADQLSSLNSLLGTSSATDSLSPLSSLLSTADSNTGDSASESSLPLLQVLIAQMQTNTSQPLSSDLTDSLSSDTDLMGLV